VPAERRPLLHLTRGIDELLRAGTEGIELLFEELESPGLEALREALRAEVRRWEARADGDPAAARVRDLFAAVLAVLETR
jgi:hypothetical protein